MLIKIILILLGLAYALSPYDLVPDFLVGLGWIDDIGVLILIWKFLQNYNRRRSRQESEQTTYQEAKQGPFSGKGAFGADPRSGRETRQNDPYEVLGIDRSASAEEIKTAYKRLAAQYHPDKVTHLGEEFRVLAEHKFKEIQKAYQELKVE